jgi:transcriptional regulator with XRE-family HTH domain
MKLNGYTQKELAMRAGCTEAAMSRYINDLRTPNVEMLINIAIALGVTADELLNLNMEEKI